MTDKQSRRIVYSEKEIESFVTRLKQIAKEFPFSLKAILRRSENSDLLEYVLQSSEIMADEKYKFSQRFEFAMNQRVDFPMCDNPSCTNKLSDPKYFLGLTKGYRHHCCASCSTSDPAVVKRHSDTCLSTHGVAWYKDDVKDKATRLMRYGDATFNNRDKAKDTYRERTGYDTPAQNPSVMKKILGVMKKILDSREAHCLEWYGVKNYLESDDFKLTCKDRYGVEHPSQNHSIFKKQRQKYFFEGIWFDSQVELAYYIWLRDTGIECIPQPDVSFQYMYEGIAHTYFPDFKVRDSFVEIKGDHFFTADGKMQNPFNHDLDGLYEAKHQCMIKNGVMIVLASACKTYVKYVKSKYGVSFFRQLKNQNESSQK